jgi:hypothetical protein
MSTTITYDIVGDDFHPSPQTPPTWYDVNREDNFGDMHWSGDLSIAFPFWQVQWNLYYKLGGPGAAYDWAWESGLSTTYARLTRCGLDRVMSGNCNVHLIKTTTEYTSPIDVIAHVAQIVAPFVAMLPGFGTIASVGLAAAAAIALGDPVDKAAIDIVSDALPMGPIRQTFLSASNFTVELYNGERVDRAAMHTTRELVGTIGGPRALTAFDTGLAIAQGAKVSDEMIALAREHINQTMGLEGTLAFDTAVGIVKNRDAPVVLQQLGRDFVYQAAGPQVAAVYDAGFALAQGETFQAAGFKFLINIAQGNDLAEKAVHFGGALAVAIQNDVPVKDILTGIVLQNLEPLGLLARSMKLPDVVDKLLGNGDLLSNLSAVDVGEYLNVPAVLAWAGQAAIKQLEDGSHVVDPDVMAVLQTPSGGVTTTTLKLASAAYRVSDPRLKTSTTAGPSAIQAASVAKPNFAQPKAVVALVNTIQQEAAVGNVDAVLAKWALERAGRALARQPWIDYYNHLGGV